MTNDPQKRLLSDGSKPPAIPQWLVVVILIPLLAFMAYALSKPAYVIAFFWPLWRNRTGG